MDFRNHHHLRSPLVSPIGYSLVYPIVDMVGATPIAGPHGIISIKLFSPTQNAQGWHTIIGTIAQRLGPISQNAHGWREFLGTISQTLFRFKQDAFGGTDTDALAAQVLYPITQHVNGFVNHGVAAQRLYRILQEADGWTNVKGSIVQNLARVIQRADGFEAVVHGDITQTLLKLTQTAIGLEMPFGPIHQTLATLLQHGVAVVEFTTHGDVTQMLFPLTQNAIGAGGPTTGMIAEILSALRTNAQGTVTAVLGPIQQTLFPIFMEADGHIENYHGFIAQTLPKVIMAGSGARTDTIIQTLYPIRQQIIAGMEAFGTAGPMKLQFIFRDVDGNIANMHAHGTVATRGDINTKIGQFKMALSGSAYDNEGSIAQFLKKITMDAEGLSPDAGFIKQTLPLFNQQALGLTAADLRIGNIKQTIVERFDTLGHRTQWISSDAEVYVSPVGSSQVMLYIVRQASEGFQSPIFGTIAGTPLPKLFQALTGGEDFPGTIDGMLLNPVFQRNVAFVVNDGAIRQTLFAPTQGLTGWSEPIGPIHQVLNGITMASGGGQITSGPIAQRLLKIQQATTGTVAGNTATVAQTLFGIRQTATDHTSLTLTTIFSADVEISTPVWPDFVLGIKSDASSLLKTLALETLGF